MPKIEIAFSHSFGVDSHDGPMFHRYHPSETDGAIAIPIDRPNGELRIFFRQRGYVTEGGLAVHDEGRHDLTASAVNLTAVINGGPLIARYTAYDAEQELIDELKLQRYGAPRGVEFAKRLLRAVITPHFVRAANSIRLLTGQYWLDSLAAWDGRDDSLGRYCQYLQMHWRSDDGEFQKFYPALARTDHRDSDATNPYAVLPDAAKWRQIAAAISRGYQPSLTGTLLLRAHQLKEDGEIRLAYLEAIAATEIIVGEAIRASIRGGEVIEKASQAVFSLSFKAQLTLVSSFLGISPDDLTLALSAYDIRCKLAHEGALEVLEGVAPLEALLRVALRLLSEPRPMLSEEPHSNERRDSSDEWAQIPGRKIHATISSMSIPPGFLPWGFDETSFGDSIPESELRSQALIWLARQDV